MLEMLSQRQQELVRLLLKRRDGLAIDALAGSLGLSRTAVRQHLAALERDGYVRRGPFRKTNGRPEQTYVLTTLGLDLFPKQYTWFSSLLLEAIKQERGSEGLAEWLRGLAKTIAASLHARVDDKSDHERLKETVAIMEELAFEAELVQEAGPGDAPAIQASNCVYHGLAVKFPEICQFDIELLSRLTGTALTHQECMARGGNVCRFSKATASEEPTKS